MSSPTCCTPRWPALLRPASRFPHNLPDLTASLSRASSSFFQKPLAAACSGITIASQSGPSLEGSPLEGSFIVICWRPVIWHLPCHHGAFDATAASLPAPLLALTLFVVGRLDHPHIACPSLLSRDCPAWLLSWTTTLTAPWRPRMSSLAKDAER